MVVSSETRAGRLMLALPGTGGTGMRATMAAKASMRWRTETVGWREVLPVCTTGGAKRATSICWPSAVSRNSGLAPVSSVASPVTT